MLIERQPYVAKCGIVDHYVGTNLDLLFRDNWKDGLNLSDMVHHLLGMPHTSRIEPWLFNVEPRPVARVVMHRSPRYHTTFPWRKVLDEYGDEAVFVGDWQEHAAFVDQFGPGLIPTDKELS